MTHSNHRRGSRESLMGDWIVFTTDARPLDPEKHRRFMDILSRHNPVGLATRRMEKDKTTRIRYVKGWDRGKDSGIFKSSTLDEIKAATGIKWGSAVYTSIDDVKAVLWELKEVDLGISVVFSGLFDKVHEACREAGTGPHTVNMSAETFGRLELLPEPKVLEITTRCGHHMVSPFLVRHLARAVKSGRMTAEDASVELAKQCTCNFFNVVRGAKMLKEYAGA